MNGQYIEKFKMDNYSLIVLVVFVLSILNLIVLLQLARNLITKQIDDQMKNMIPIKSIRERVGIKIKYRK
tara:strand:+ start:208 stop:417 length:210 start_codon:yes stop_codon:yes gene_type:complete